MRFLVCVKQVVDTSKMEVDPNTGRLNRNNANSIINPLDLHALEAALALRDQVGGTVTVLTMGPPQAEQVLQYAVSMGADDVYLQQTAHLAALIRWLRAILWQQPSANWAALT